jgi:uncharacterized protein
MRHHRIFPVIPSNRIPSETKSNRRTVMEAPRPTNHITDGLDPEVRRVVEYIVEEVHPLRIILFGSRATGTARPESDIDLLVVMPEGTPCRETMVQLGSRIPEREVDVDLLVATPSLLERHRDNPGLVYRQILRTGREVFNRTGR